MILNLLVCPQIGFNVSPWACLHEYIVLVQIAYNATSIASFFPKLRLFLEIMILSLKFRFTEKTKQVQIIYLLLKKHDIFCILSYVLTLIKHNLLLHLIQD